jgi:hypothetical protein
MASDGKNKYAAVLRVTVKIMLPALKEHEDLV